jgi:hypothetical protein
VCTQNSSTQQDNEEVEKKERIVETNITNGTDRLILVVSSSSTKRVEISCVFCNHGSGGLRVPCVRCRPRVRLIFCEHDSSNILLSPTWALLERFGGVRWTVYGAPTKTGAAMASTTF